MDRRDKHCIEQPTLFDPPAPKPSEPLVGPIETIDPNVHPDDGHRLRGQNARVLALLEERPATNDELIKIGRKYTSRISDVRKFLNRGGRTIECIRGEGGLNTYRIVELKRHEQ